MQSNSFAKVKRYLQSPQSKASSLKKMIGFLAEMLIIGVKIECSHTMKTTLMCE